MKKLIIPPMLAILLVAVLVIQSVFISVSFSKIHKLENAKNPDQRNSFAVSMAALNATGFSQPAVSVSDNKVYLPDIRLALPLNSDTTSLLYSSRETGNPTEQTTTTYDVTTRSLASLSPVGFQQQLACYPIRLAFEDKANPFNPHEKDNAAVKLADGRTLQIYAHDDSKCAAQWQAAKIDPDTLKNAFKQATSY
jgi:hypothetical protein